MYGFRTGGSLCLRVGVVVTLVLSRQQCDGGSNAHPCRLLHSIELLVCFSKLAGLGTVPARLGGVSHSTAWVLRLLRFRESLYWTFVTTIYRVRRRLPCLCRQSPAGFHGRRKVGKI